MASWERRERVTRIIEYSVPCNGLWGADWAEVDKACAAITRDYRQAHGLPDTASVSGGVIRFFPGDDQILIRFEAPSQGES